tara:strand:+ start:1442 stop:1822 length:381 start_codon:yes stop_codon:yes gene_type:complete
MEIQRAFNTHFIEFVDDIGNYFSENMEIQTTATTLRTAKKVNPKLIISVWYDNIVKKYDDKIEKGDISFFVTKEYSDDVSGNNTILNGIDRIRKPVQEMPTTEQEKAMKYVQNLTKLCKLYYLNRN